MQTKNAGTTLESGIKFEITIMGIKHIRDIIDNQKRKYMMRNTGSPNISVWYRSIKVS